MTYRMNCSQCCPPMGSYYTYGTHQVFDGFGAVAFDAASVWADAQEGGKVGQYQQEKSLLECDKIPEKCASVQAKINNANFRGNRAANAIRAGLRDLGYEPGLDDTMWGGADKTAWASFAADNGVPAGPGLVSKSGVFKMGELLGGGASSKAGLGPLGWTLLLLAAAAGGVALVSGRRKKNRPRPTGRAQIALRR